MPGGQTTTQQQTQNSSTAPWTPTQPLLTNILSQLGTMSTTPTGAQTDALAQLEANARSMPNMGPQATNVVTNLMSGGGPDYSGILNSGYDTLKGQLSPFASGDMVNKNAALKSQLDVVGNDTKNAIESQFAAAGRPAGTNADVAQAVARGTMQAQAPIIAGQYNQDVTNQMDAIKSLYGASGTTAAGLTGLNQTRLGNQVQGLGAAGALPGILNQGASSLFAAGNAQQALPYGGLGMLSSLLNPIAGMGAQSTGNATGRTTQEGSTASNILGGTLGGIGLLGGTGAFGSAGWLAPLMMSDERTKEDIAPVGILNDGSNVYAFKYKGDPSKRTHIGLMAQEVERVTPQAVVEVGGVKLVDYEKATRPARAIGILNDMRMAA